MQTRERGTEEKRIKKESCSQSSRIADRQANNGGKELRRRESDGGRQEGVEAR